MSEWTGVSMLVSRNPEIQEMDIGKSKVKFYEKREVQSVKKIRNAS